jgi:hypothetical protein
MGRRRSHLSAVIQHKLVPVMRLIVRPKNDLLYIGAGWTYFTLPPGWTILAPAPGGGLYTAQGGLPRRQGNVWRVTGVLAGIVAMPFNNAANNIVVSVSVNVQLPG